MTWFFWIRFVLPVKLWWRRLWDRLDQRYTRVR